MTNRSNKSKNVKHLVRLSMFAAIALTVFILEAQLPSPVFYIPGIKLGLANVVTLYLLADCSKKDALSVSLARILLGSFFAGQMVSLIYSLAGGLLSFCTMSLCIKLFGKRLIWFTGAVGGVSHNIGQICAAAVILKSTYVFAYLPLLILFGIAAGLFCGFTADFFLKHVHRIIEK